MKKHRLLPLLVTMSVFSTLTLGAVSLPSASAQPGAAAAGKKGRAKGVRGGVPKRMREKIEEKMGKPLTPDQLTRLNTAYKARMDAQKAAQAKFASEVVNITGLTEEQVTELNKRGPRAGGVGKATAAR